MSETFKYIRLEISSVLFRSWSDLLTILRRKHSDIEKKYFAFLYCGRERSKGRGIKNQNYITRFKCGYFIYTYKDVYNFFNRYQKDKDKYSLAVEHKLVFLKRLKEIYDRFNNNRKTDDFYSMLGYVETKTPFKNNDILQHSIPMITLNAAIVEGTLREILARYIQNEINKYIEEGNKEGRYHHNNYQKLLVSKQIKIESNSSYGSIIDEYSVLFELKQSDLVGKEIIKIIDSLFTLRNIFAHGTSIVTTNIPVEHDQYFKTWNKRVGDLQKILEKYFGSDLINENISDYRLAEFFMSYSRMYLIKIANFVKKYDDSGCKAVESVNIVKVLNSERGLSYTYDEYYLSLYDFPKK